MNWFGLILPNRLRDAPQLRRAARLLLQRWAARLPPEAAIAQAFVSGHFRQRDLAEFFGLSEATVSRMVRQPGRMLSQGPFEAGQPVSV